METKEQVRVLVNENPVLVPRHTTGLGIKEAAIQQGVTIKADFNLFRVDGNKQHPVSDTQEVAVHESDRFRAVAGDDNSPC